LFSGLERFASFQGYSRSPLAFCAGATKNGNAFRMPQLNWVVRVCRITGLICVDRLGGGDVSINFSIWTSLTAVSD
jgi:hypothetical protein